MRVRCTASTGDRLPASCIDPALGLARSTAFPLTVGQLYTVFAVTTFKCLTWYYVLDDNHLPYPVWKIAELFEVDDPAIPDSWVVGYLRPNASEVGFPVLSFPEWALDHGYYERLVDGEAHARLQFEKRRAEAEF